MLPDDLIIIGQAPKRGGRPDLPLYPWPPNCTGARLKRMMGLRIRQYLALDRRNLFVNFTGMKLAGKGDAFPLVEARDRAREMRAELWGRHVPFVGIGVAKAFGHKDPKPCSWCRLKPYTRAVIPHPSGINRWWNDPANRRRGSRFLARLGRSIQKDHAPKPFQKAEQNQ